MKLAPGTKVLITGGTGHLGGALVRLLVRERGLHPADLRIFYLAGTPAGDFRDVPGLEFAPGDIFDPQSVRRACAGRDAVFHLAASTSFDPAQKALQWRVNVEGTRNLLDAVRQTPSIKRVCHTGTVNALAAPRPFGSTGGLDDCDPYAGAGRLHSFRTREETLGFIEAARRGERGWERRIGIGYFDSKLAAQELVRNGVEHHGLDVVSVLPGTMFGPFDAFVGSGIFLLSIYHRRLPAVLRGGISAVHVMDAAEGHLLAMEKGRTGGRYILTGPAGSRLYFRDMAGVMADVLNERFPGRRLRRRFSVTPFRAALAAAWISEKSARLRRRPCLLSRGAVRAGSEALFYSPEQAGRELGYAPRRSFRRAVEEMVEDYAARGLFAERGRRIDRRP